MILLRVCRNLIKQCVTVVEWKQIFGMVFDEEGALSLEKELAIFERVQTQIRAQYPLFTMKIVACGLKLLGREHAQSQIDAYFDAPKYSDMVTGFDLVCEEDYNPELDRFLDLIYEAKARAAKIGREFPVYLHCGESNSRSN
jgi:adenosine deaminase CECR1